MPTLGVNTAYQLKAQLTAIAAIRHAASTNTPLEAHPDDHLLQRLEEGWIPRARAESTTHPVPAHRVDTKFANPRPLICLIFVTPEQEDGKQPTPSCTIDPEGKSMVSFPYNHYWIQHIEIRVLTIGMLIEHMLEGEILAEQLAYTVFLFSKFACWKDIVCALFQATGRPNMSPNYNEGQRGWAVSAGDSSRSHLLNPITLQLAKSLLILNNYNSQLAINNLYKPWGGDGDGKDIFEHGVDAYQKGKASIGDGKKWRAVGGERGTTTSPYKPPSRPMATTSDLSPATMAKRSASTTAGVGANPAPFLLRADWDRLDTNLASMPEQALHNFTIRSRRSRDNPSSAPLVPRKVVDEVYGMNGFRASKGLQFCFSPEELSQRRGEITQKVTEFLNTELEENKVYKGLLVGAEDEGGLVKSAGPAFYFTMKTRASFIAMKIVSGVEELSFKYHGLDFVNWTLSYKTWISSEILQERFELAIQKIQDRETARDERKMKRPWIVQHAEGAKCPPTPDTMMMVNTPSPLAIQLQAPPADASEEEEHGPVKDLFSERAQQLRAKCDGYKIWLGRVGSIGQCPSSTPTSSTINPASTFTTAEELNNTELSPRAGESHIRKRGEIIKVTQLEVPAPKWQDAVLPGGRRAGAGFEVTAEDSDGRITRWEDRWIVKGRGEWVRRFIGGVALYYKDTDFLRFEIAYRTQYWEEAMKELTYDNRFGAADIETYTSLEEGSRGKQIAYSCGYIDHKKKVMMFYYRIGDRENQVVIRMIDHLLTPAHNGCTFYVHNHARFDSRLILDALGKMENVKVRLWAREMNEIFKIRVSKVLSDGKSINIILQDSYYHLPFKLEQLAIKFECEVKKGEFPHRFVTKDNLFYIGPRPGPEFYPGSPSHSPAANNLQPLQEGKWDLRKENLSYLRSDLESLHQVMTKYSEGLFKDFAVNARNVSSYSALSRRVYLSCYYRKGWTQKIPVIAGHLEEWIRQAYKGGVVDVLQHLVKEGAIKYDSNSHYPASMLNAMPVGQPRVSDCTDLDKIFGFCDAEVTAPPADKLRVPILPTWDKSGALHCPRGTWRDTYFSEELKDAVKYGYQVRILSAVQFDKGKNIFQGFVKEMYNRRLTSNLTKDGVGKLLYKLIANSLFGKAGQKEITHSFKLMPLAQAQKYQEKYKTDLSQVFGNKILLRTQGKLEAELEGILLGTEESRQPDWGAAGLARRSKHHGVKSSVSIAAAITAYGRILMNRFKNLPDNRYLGGDTDSAIMEKELPKQYIGPGLGMMKEECKLKLGLFADKKLYLVREEGPAEEPGTAVVPYAAPSPPTTAAKAPPTTRIITTIKSRGVGRQRGRDILTFRDFLIMMGGGIVNIVKEKFMIKPDGIYIQPQQIVVRLGPSRVLEVKAEIQAILATDNHPLQDICREILAIEVTSLTLYHPPASALSVWCPPPALCPYNPPTTAILPIPPMLASALTIYRPAATALLCLQPELSLSSPPCRALAYSPPPLQQRITSAPAWALCLNQPRCLISWSHPALSLLTPASSALCPYSPRPATIEVFSPAIKPDFRSILRLNISLSSSPSYCALLNPGGMAEFACAVSITTLTINAYYSDSTGMEAMAIVRCVQITACYWEAAPSPARDNPPTPHLLSRQPPFCWALPAAQLRPLLSPPPTSSAKSPENGGGGKKKNKKKKNKGKKKNNKQKWWFMPHCSPSRVR